MTGTMGANIAGIFASFGDQRFTVSDGILLLRVRG